MALGHSFSILLYFNSCNWSAVTSQQKASQSTIYAAELLKLMDNIAEVPCQVLLDAHLCQQPSGVLMDLLLVIQSSCTNTDVLELWSVPQTSNMGVDDNGDLHLCNQSNISTL